MFSSFMMAGFECTFAKVAAKKRLDMLQSTKHDVYVKDDYQLIKKMGILTAREGFAWHQIDRGDGRYDFSRFEPLIAAGQEMGIEQIWDLNHFDYPDYLDPFTPEFLDAFARYSVAVVRLLRKYYQGTLFLVPFNEISFFAWIGADQGLWAPFLQGSHNGFLFKQQLVKAALLAMDKMWSIDSHLRFIHVDPFMRRVAKPPANEEALKHVNEFNNVIRFEVWDMLSGKTYPELGGGPQYLDIIGVNYYIHNQEWVLSKRSGGIRHRMMGWNSPDRISFASMLQTIFNRYHRPMVVSETGSFGRKRSSWWQRVLTEVDEALEQHLPVTGVCIYPTVDRPDSAGFLLPNSGIFDFRPDDEFCLRVPHRQSVRLIQNYAQRLDLAS